MQGSEVATPILPLLSSEPAPMAKPASAARLSLDPPGSPDALSFAQSYNREPLGFKQNLHTLDIFQPDSLERLCATFSASGRGFFVAEGAPSAGTAFNSVPHGGLNPSEALALLDQRPLRILLKRPENQDDRFRVLLHTLFQQVVDLRGGMQGERVVRLESAVLISSASTITPLHFDPEIGFFSQIAGEKIYHVYSPSDVSELEMEPFYIGGAVDIAELAMERRDPAREYVFCLKPGSGLHQPQNAPHWVETGGRRSVSYTFVFETDRSRALGRTRAFNHYQRKVGLTPALPERHAMLDARKADVMRAIIPLRRAAGAAMRMVHLR